MVMPVTFRNVITGDQHDVPVGPGQTIRQAVESAGIIAPGSHFVARDQGGAEVDDDPATQHDGEMLQIGPPGNIQGGRIEYRR
jgi:hypothetical protein